MTVTNEWELATEIRLQMELMSQLTSHYVMTITSVTLKTSWSLIDQSNWFWPTEWSDDFVFSFRYITSMIRVLPSLVGCNYFSPLSQNSLNFPHVCNQIFLSSTFWDYYQLNFNWRAKFLWIYCDRHFDTRFF